MWTEVAPGTAATAGVGAGVPAVAVVVVVTEGAVVEFVTVLGTVVAEVFPRVVVVADCATVVVVAAPAAMTPGRVAVVPGTAEEDAGPAVVVEVEVDGVDVVGVVAGVDVAVDDPAPPAGTDGETTVNGSLAQALVTAVMWNAGSLNVAWNQYWPVGVAVQIVEAGITPLVTVRFEPSAATRLVQALSE